MIALFGPWLFPAASPDTGTEFLQARAVSTGALVAIFSTQQLRVPAPATFSAFVGLVAAGLQETLVAHHILLRGTALFTHCVQQHELWVLIPLFVALIKQVLEGRTGAGRTSKGQGGV